MPLKVFKKPSQKATRGTRQHVEAGYDTEGQPLPEKDDSKWSPKQIYVFQKCLQDCPQQLKDAWAESQASGDKARQRELVNSIVPKDSSYAMVMPFKGDEQRWKHILKCEDRQETDNRAEGVSKARMKATLGEYFDEALLAGDIWQEDGMWYERKVIHSDKRSKVEENQYLTSGALTDEQASKLLGMMESYDTRCFNVRKVHGPKADNAKKSTCPTVRAPEATVLQLQNCHDAMSSVTRNITALVKNLIKPGVSKTIKDLCLEANGQAKILRGFIEKGMDMLLAANPDHKSIHAFVLACKDDFEKATSQEKELKLFVGHLKKEEREEEKGMKKRPAAAMSGGSSGSKDIVG